jgi:hypothetical protein
VVKALLAVDHLDGLHLVAERSDLIDDDRAQEVRGRILDVTARPRAS